MPNEVINTRTDRTVIKPTDCKRQKLLGKNRGSTLVIPKTRLQRQMSCSSCFSFDGRNLIVFSFGSYEAVKVEYCYIAYTVSNSTLHSVHTFVYYFSGWSQGWGHEMHRPTDG